MILSPQMRPRVLPAALLVAMVAVVSSCGIRNSSCPKVSGDGVGRTGRSEADAGHRSYGQNTCKGIPNSHHCLRMKRGILPGVEEQPGEHGGRREKRSVSRNSKNEVGPSLQLMRVLISTVLRHKIPVFFHDSTPVATDLLQKFFAREDHFPAVVADLSADDLLSPDWLRSYNDECYVHVILFSSIEVVRAFAEQLPELTWTPALLLLLNLNTSVSADLLLPHRAFNHSPFLTLLQAAVTRGVFRFDIHTYNIFGDDIDYIGHTYPDFSRLQFGDVFPDRFESFHGVNLHLASWADDFPYLVPQDTLEETTGIGIYMLREIGSKLNFTYTVYQTPEDHWWGDFTNGSWRGMIGELWRREK